MALRLIDVDRYRQVISREILDKELPTNEEVGILSCIAILDEQPIFDIVPCGECQYYQTEECPMIGKCDACDCSVDFSFNSTGFCSKGKRRERKSDAKEKSKNT